MTEDQLACIAIYQSIKNRLTITCDEYLDLLKDWTIKPLKRQNKVIGGVMIKGNEIHIGYCEFPYASVRKYIKDVLKPLIKEHGFVVTVVLSDNKAGLKFCTRLGFYEINQDSSKITLKCNGVNYA